jgi:nucleoside recognition membrane protein YjiH
MFRSLMAVNQEECYVCNKILLCIYVDLLVSLPCLIAQCKVMDYLKLLIIFFHRVIYTEYENIKRTENLRQDSVEEHRQIVTSRIK